MKLLVGKILKHLESPRLAIQLPNEEIIEVDRDFKDSLFYEFYITGENLLSLRKSIDEELADGKN